jgi:hypothetical protein
LGKRIEKIKIVNEKDCIKVIPKGWMQKPTWREINDILRLNGFSWLSNGKDSCWLKPLHNNDTAMDEIERRKVAKHLTNADLRKLEQKLRLAGIDI